MWQCPQFGCRLHQVGFLRCAAAQFDNLAVSSWVYRETLQQNITMREDTPNAFKYIEGGCAPFNAYLEEM